MSILTFDLETETHTLHKRKASPWHPDNRVVAAGFKINSEPPFGQYFRDKKGWEQTELPLKGIKLLVGFNIKFDLLWCWDKKSVKDFFKRGGIIWDCQYVEYLLEGHQQHAQMASMDSIVEKYGGTLKISEVKKLWEDGVQTSEISETLLMNYLIGDEKEGIAGDINNTYTIFLGQLKRAKRIHPNFIQMIKNRMDGLLATTECEYNGLFIDVERGNRDQRVLSETEQALGESLNTFIPELPAGYDFNWNSIYDKSCLIFGGTGKYQHWVQHKDPEGYKGLAWCKKTERWPVFNGVPVDPTSIGIGVSDCASGDVYSWISPENKIVEQDTYKSGKRKGEGKTKNVTVDDLTKPKGAMQDGFFAFPGYTKPLKEWASKLTDAKGDSLYKVSSEVIEKLGERTDIPFLDTLGKSTRVKKDLSTYYWVEDDDGHRTGMLTLVDDDGIIHHKLNHTTTTTSRLSASDPNMQNIARKDKSLAKAMFKSRFEDGVMAEIDYSQLEVVVQGMLSRDRQLCKDLNDRIDFHIKRLSAKTGRSYDELKALHKEGDPWVAAERTKIKGFTFQRAYGAGADAISASTGMSVEEVASLIEAESRLYPGVEKFDKQVEAAIESSRIVTATELFVEGRKYNVSIGEWFAPTGTRYVWRENEAPAFLHRDSKYLSFSPTARKNWPIQGTGGEVVQTMLGKVWRWLLQNDNFGGKALLVNTVHDCVWLDIDQSVVDKVVPAVKRILEAVPLVFNKDFALNVQVPFPCEAEVGPNMLELEHYGHSSKKGGTKQTPVPATPEKDNHVPLSA